jgi:hypothetical protein
LQEARRLHRATHAVRGAGEDHVTGIQRECGTEFGDLLATYQRLRSDGIEPYWCINHGPNLSFYYRDPDGNQIELQIDVFESTEAVNAWYANSDFAANPIGVKFDAEELIRRFENGEPFESLTRRPQIAPDQVLAQLP